MDKQYLKSHSLEEVAKKFDEEMKEYTSQVNTIEDRALILDMEQQLLKDQDEVNNYLKDISYELPKDVVFDGQKSTVKDVANKIIYFLNKKEVEWKYTLGLYQLVKFWKQENPTTITYGAYDSTLRLLNQVSFAGFQEWRDILTVNEYLKSAHESYSKDTSWLVFCAEKHNALMDKLKQLDTADADATENVN